MKLIEVLAAAAVAFVLTWLLVRLAGETIFVSHHLGARLDGRSATDRLAERLESDAASAWTIFVPASDVFGASNADAHELDFAAQDASHHTYWWAYGYAPATQRVTVYAYTPGSKPVAGDVFDGITGFGAESHPVTDLAERRSDVYDALFDGTTVTPVDFDFGWSTALATGGNRLTRVQLEGAGVDRTLLLASATAPTHFTVVVEYTPAPATPAP
ncbi:MAG TPA: hypothetical protein VK760_00585 [Candidatus Acidoferrales bacterium]|nr:hypothetical protein [Candidatus Acidoferrales bacterium]